MRQAILIIFLIAAAFLGGAFVNGPGLQWAQLRVLRLVGLSNGGEIAAVDLESNLSSEIAPEPAELRNQRTAITPSPVAAIPSLVSKDKPSKEDPSEKVSKHRPMEVMTNLGSGRTPSTIFSFGTVGSLNYEIIVKHRCSRVETNK